MTALTARAGYWRGARVVPCARWLMIERRSGLVWLHQGLGVEARLETEVLQVRFSRGAHKAQNIVIEYYR